MFLQNRIVFIVIIFPLLMHLYNKIKIKINKKKYNLFILSIKINTSDFTCQIQTVILYFKRHLIKCT